MSSLQIFPTQNPSPSLRSLYSCSTTPSLVSNKLLFPKEAHSRILRRTRDPLAAHAQPPSASVCRSCGPVNTGPALHVSSSNSGCTQGGLHKEEICRLVLFRPHGVVWTARDSWRLGSPDASSRPAYPVTENWVTDVAPLIYAPFPPNVITYSFLDWIQDKDFSRQVESFLRNIYLDAARHNVFLLKQLTFVM